MPAVGVPSQQPVGEGPSRVPEGWGAAAIAAGIGMRLHLVARRAGDALAAVTARQMDVLYRREPGQA